MKKLALLLALSLSTISSVHSQTTPANEPEFFYDLFIRDSCLTTWIDLSPLLDGQGWDRLSDGVDIALECRVELSTPRWLWSDHQVTERVRTVRLSYRKVTDDFVLDPGDSSQARTLIDSGKIEGYLADSVEICVQKVSAIDPEKTLKVNFKITSIFLTDLNLADKVSSDEGADSPVKYLFRRFLELTDYGRRQYSVKSRPFTLGDVPQTP